MTAGVVLLIVGIAIRAIDKWDWLYVAAFGTWMFFWFDWSLNELIAMDKSGPRELVVILLIMGLVGAGVLSLIRRTEKRLTKR